MNYTYLHLQLQTTFNMPSLIINTDANDVSRRTRAVQKVRVPKHVAENKRSKYAESSFWKHRKGKEIQKSRDAKYTNDTEVRGEEEEVNMVPEEFNNLINGMEARPFVIYKDIPESYIYKILPSGPVQIVRPAKCIPVLCGTSYEHTRNEENDIVVVNCRMDETGKLARYRRHFHVPMRVMAATLFELAQCGPGAYRMRYTC
jgi:hypothetical protein